MVRLVIIGHSFRCSKKVGQAKPALRSEEGEERAVGREQRAESRILYSTICIYIYLQEGLLHLGTLILGVDVRGGTPPAPVTSL